MVTKYTYHYLKHKQSTYVNVSGTKYLEPKDGKPVVTPSQDMVLGNYYLTLERKDAVNTGIIFNDTNEVLKAYANGYVHLHSYRTCAFT